MHKLKNICVLSLATKDIRSFAEPIFKNNKEYCEKHGYDWVEHWKLKEGWPQIAGASWSKIPYILDELDKGYDWVFWIDADALVMDNEVKLEEFTDDRFDFIITSSGASWQCGVFFTQNTDLSRELLNEVYERGPVYETVWPYENRAVGWEQARFINHCIESSSRVKVLRADKGEKHFNSLTQAFARNGYWENGKSITRIGRFNEIFHEDSFRKIEYKEGDFILHFAGYQMEGKDLLGDLKKFRPDLFTV